MMPFRLLLVEDDARERALCRESAEVYLEQKQRRFEIVECATVEQAFDQLYDSFDGAIIDLKLDSEADSGNKVIERISESMYRIPVAIFTGTPDPVEGDVIPYLGVFKKGAQTYSHIFDLFWQVHSTGLTRIIGGRGQIELALKKVFETNLWPSRAAWIGYGASDPERTERALLRYTVNHLLQLLDCNEDRYYPEEVYIHPPLTEALMTGTIVKSRTDDVFFVVLNPACDLVIREKTNSCKTDRILLVQVDDGPTVIASTSDIGTYTKDGKKTDLTQKYLQNEYSMQAGQSFHAKVGSGSTQGGQLVNWLSQCDAGI